MVFHKQTINVYGILGGMCENDGSNSRNAPYGTPPKGNLVKNH